MIRQTTKFILEILCANKKVTGKECHQFSFE